MVRRLEGIAEIMTKPEGTILKIKKQFVRGGRILDEGFQLIEAYECRGCHRTVIPYKHKFYEKLDVDTFFEWDADTGYCRLCAYKMAKVYHRPTPTLKEERFDLDGNVKSIYSDGTSTVLYEKPLREHRVFSHLEIE